MSRLQRSQNEQPKQLKYIVVCSGAAHIILLALLLFTVGTDVIRLDMHQHAHEARVICVPSYCVPAKQKAPEKKKKIAEKKEPKKKQEKEKQAKQEKVETQITAPVVQKKVEEVKKVPEKVVEEKKQEQQLEEQILYVNKETYSHMQLARELQEGIAAHWQPPPGIAGDCSCDIQLTVNGAGRAMNVNVVKKSGSALYDMAARQAIMKTMYPKGVYGRTVVVHFSEDFTCGTPASL